LGKGGRKLLYDAKKKLESPGTSVSEVGRGEGTPIPEEKEGFSGAGFLNTGWRKTRRNFY